MISVENNLKNLILTKYKSVREFCFAIDMPYSTIDSILKRGIENAGVGKIIKICKHLKISADELAIGNIVPIDSLTQYSKNDFSSREQNLIKKYRILDDRGKISIEKMLDIQLQAMEFETKNQNNDKIS